MVHDIGDTGNIAEYSTYHGFDAYPFLTMSAFVLEVPWEISFLF
jgi:hypothetical protein